MAALTVERRDSVVYLTFDRPEAQNALDPEMIVLLGRAFREYAEDVELRCAVLTGRGDTAFSAGADLRRTIPLLTGAREPEDEWDRALLGEPVLMQYALLRGVDVFKPVVAAVNGYCIAGGMELLQATDVRIAVNTATFALQEAKWGLFPGAGSTVRLPQQIPYCKAMEMLLTGERITAQEALQWGLVNHVVPRSQLGAKVEWIVRTIAENGPLAVRKIKESVIRCMGRPIEEALAREPEFAMTVFASEDAREGPRAFAENRLPDFRGR
ncbi:MAG: enoyl-CoA hydratase [Candidatus Binatota bacterium]|nr:enoyl-CoA hydratase [Candidatus Binatota bacterium]